MKRILVCGSQGFIAHHLIRKLKKQGYWIRGVDIKSCIYKDADEFLQLDLRKEDDCKKALRGGFDEVYQLANDFGGMGYIEVHDINCMRNVLINLNVIQQAVKAKVKKYFFSSSVCIYRDMKIGEPALIEKDAYPANPDNEYGWEKLFTERLLLAYARRYPIEVRIARFQNCYGTECSWNTDRAKAPIAICKKVAEAKNEIEVWGNGSATRNYTHIDDMLDGIIALMNSDIKEPANIGTYEEISVDQLADTIIKISGKDIKKNYIEGPVGVQYRNFDKSRIISTGWKPKVKLKDGIREVYQWVLNQL